MLETLDISTISTLTFWGAFAFAMWLLYLSGVLQAWSRKINNNVKRNDTSQYRINERVQEQIDGLVESLKVSNHEMGLIQRDIATMTNDIKWIREVLGKK